ncbi:MAG: ribosomal RNA small subunit methyltransferase A [Proteobacteria bacterium]|nr:ribosomal RNA small subunit methyltransferase A [Pseudomonadota bacterium]
MSWKKYRKGGSEVGKPRVKSTLQDLNVTPTKTRGQNFIIDPAVVDSIVAFGAPRPGERLIEIGPGLGALTERLVPFGNLAVIEIEEKFCQELATKHPQVEIINDDVRLVDFSELGQDLVVFGNLPYSFSTDIIFHLIAFAGSISRAVLMLQKEFAERVAAAPGGKSYGVLSVSCQLSCDVRLGPVVPGTAFHPPTAVDSQVLELTFPRQPRYQVDDIYWVKRVVSAAFVMRRKMLKNSLRASKIASGDAIDRALERSGVDPMRRAETLSIPEFLRLAQALRPD